MAIITVHFAPLSMRRTLCTSEAVEKLVQDTFGEYTSHEPFYSPLIGEEAAEDVFDLSNNPSREFDRKFVFKDARTVNVGDVVEVDYMGVPSFFLCKGIGWAKLDFTS
jgi:hypothetical protein